MSVACKSGFQTCVYVHRLPTYPYMRKISSQSLTCIYYGFVAGLLNWLVIWPPTKLSELIHEARHLIPFPSSSTERKKKSSFQHYITTHHIAWHKLLVSRSYRAELRSRRYGTNISILVPLTPLPPTPSNAVSTHTGPRSLIPGDHSKTGMQTVGMGHRQGRLCSRMLIIIRTRLRPAVHRTESSPRGGVYFQVRHLRRGARRTAP